MNKLIPHNRHILVEIIEEEEDNKEDEDED